MRAFDLPLLPPWSPNFPQIMKVFRFLTEREDFALSSLSAEQTLSSWAGLCVVTIAQKIVHGCALCPPCPVSPISPPSSGTVVLCSVFASSPLLPAHRKLLALGDTLGGGHPCRPVY